MTSFRHLSIRLKLLVIVLTSLVVSLLISTSAIALLDHRLAGSDFKNQLQVLADITANRSQAALAFRDKRTVNNNLESLSRQNAIDKACVYDQNGKVFASYLRDPGKDICSSEPVADEILLAEDVVVASRSIELNERLIGKLEIHANTQELSRRLWQFIQYAGGIMIFSLIVAYTLSMSLQRALTFPLIKLSRLTEIISRTHDFSLRARAYNRDETGQLAESFNDLINTIQDSQMQMQELVLELQEKTQQLESHTELVEDRNKVIRNMFSGAAHDLKQPLQAMSLFTNALEGMTLDDKQKELVQKLELSIQNMRSLFEDLLDVSKLESRLENVEHGPVELKPLLDSVYQEFDALAADKQLEFRFHARDFVVDSNARMLERIIRNLLSNAIRYTPRGGILLACRLRGRDVCVEIWDTGIGIPEAKFDSIFKRFYQVESHVKESAHGYGLGLSIVKRLSEMLKHPIEIQSREGRGTMFRVRLPMYRDESMKQIAPSTLTSMSQAGLPAEASHGSDPLTESDASANRISVLPGEAIQVLLVDDDELVREGLKTLMEGWRMQVVDYESIADMKAALANSEEHAFNIIVSDFQLSETENGLDAIAEARGLLGEELPALIVTGTDDQTLIDMIKASGIRHLKKPVKAAKLRALINHLVSAA